MACKKLTGKAPAKFNRYLKVFEKQFDGFHRIESVVSKLSIYDELTIEPSEHTEVQVSFSEKLRLHMKVPAIDGENILTRTLRLFSNEINERGKHFIVSLRKEIPIGAGLGGGSSDAACLLRLLNNYFGNPLGSQRLIELGRTLGSDVPLFLLPGDIFVSGSGDEVSSLDSEPVLAGYVVKPPVFVSTAEAYQWLGRGSQLADVRHDTNDFQRPVVARFKELQETVDTLRSLSPEDFTMCGSGSSFFVWFQRVPEVIPELRSLEERGWFVERCKTL